MLREVKGMHGTILLARDGEIGKVEEVLFDDHLWTVRYLVVNTGGWPLGRKVLLPPAVLEGPFLDQHLLNVNLTRDQVERSPAAETDKPVSRQWETDYYDYYVWPYYWAGMGATGIPWYSGALLPDAGDGMPEPPPEHSDPHLRSTNEVTGYKIEAQDGPLGHVADFIVDDETWNIRYVAADTGEWWPGKKVLLPLHWIAQVRWLEGTVQVRVTRDQVQDGPAWDPHAPITPLFENELFRYDSQQRQAVLTA